MIEETRPLIAGVVEGEGDLANDILERGGLAERGRVLREERTRHVHPVQPHLVRVDPFVPEAARPRARLGAQLVAQHVERGPVPGVRGLVREREQDLAGVDEVQYGQAAHHRVRRPLRPGRGDGH